MSSPEPCIDALHRACVGECRVDSIYECARARHINGDNARFFTDPLPGCDQALAFPGGATTLGQLGADTALFAAHPPKST